MLSLKQSTEDVQGPLLTGKELCAPKGAGCFDPSPWFRQKFWLLPDKASQLGIKQFCFFFFLFQTEAENPYKSGLRI